MTGYLQRLLDRSQPAPAPSGAPGGDAPLARPAMPSRSPIAAADQRLHDPALAGLIGMTPPAQGDEAHPLGPEPGFGMSDPLERPSRRQGTADQHPTVPAERHGRRGTEAPPPDPTFRRSEVLDSATSTQPFRVESDETRPPDEPAAESAETQPPPVPVEHPLRRLDVDFTLPPAEPTPQPPPSPASAPDPSQQTAKPAAPELRLVERSAPETRQVPLSEQARSPASTDTPPHPIEQQQAPITAETPHTAEPPPLPAPPPPSPDPETIIIEKTEPAPQVVRTEQPAPEAKPPEPVERPRPRPKTAAAASLIGPLPQRMRVRTLFGVRRR